MTQAGNHTQPLVSIALATYNGEAFLAAQLDSLIAQTYPNLEVIIFDDGSADGTIRIIESYLEKFSSISFYKNEGPHGIKNNFAHALSFCTGTYIALCDQDDTWLPQKIERMVAEIGNYALIYHNSLFIDETGNSMNRTLTDKLRGYTGHDPKAFLLLNGVSGHACMFQKKLVPLALPFPRARFHDWWLAFIAAQNGGVKYLDEVLVHYRQHEKSKTDMLAQKSRTQHRKEFRIFDEETEWYNSCAKIEGKEQAFFQNWAELYAARKDRWLSFSLFRLAQKNSGILYSFKKKNKASRFFESLKLLWGLKTKKAVG